MTEDTTSKQAAAADADAPNKSEAEVKGAQGDELDQYLKEFETGTEAKADAKTEDKPKADAGKDTTKADIAEIKDFVTEARQRQTEQDLKSTVAKVKASSDALKGLSDAFIEGRLEVEARKDPRIRDAWLQRGRNPEAFERVIESLGKRIAKEVQPAVDPQLTKDRDAARAAVSNASTGDKGAADQPDNASLSKLNDAEFQAYKKGRGARARA